MRLFRRPIGAAVAGIGVAIGLASLAGFALLALIGRLLTPADFGLFVSFWGVLFGIGGSLSTIEQESARRTATGDGERGPSPTAVTAAAAGLAALAASITLLPPVAARLYGEEGGWLGLVVVLSAVGFAIQFTVRGVLIGSNSVRGYAGIVIAEAVARLVLLLVVVVAFGASVTTAAIAVAAGSFVWLIWSRRARAALPLSELKPRDAWPATQRAGSLMIAAALTASVITGYPTMVAALTDQAPGAAGGAVFAALTVSRVPLLLVSPIQAMAVPAVIRLRSVAPQGRWSPLRKLLVAGPLAFACLGVLGGAAGWHVGPQIVQLVYGPAYEVPPAAVAMLVASAFMLAWVLLTSAALVAFAAYRQMIVMWLAAAGATAVWLALSPLDVVDSTAIGAMIGPLAAMAWGIPVLWRLTSPSLAARSAASQ